MVHLKECHLNEVQPVEQERSLPFTRRNAVKHCLAKEGNSLGQYSSSLEKKRLGRNRLVDLIDRCPTGDGRHYDYSIHRQWNGANSFVIILRTKSAGYLARLECLIGIQRVNSTFVFLDRPYSCLYQNEAHP